MTRRRMVFLFGQGGWIWWHAALAVTFVMLLASGVYAWLDPKNAGGALLMFLAFSLAWFAMLVFCTVDVVRWSLITQYGWGMRLLFILLAWIAVGLLWTFLFWASDPNYPEKLLPGRILFTTHCVALYVGNLWMLSAART